MTLKVMPKSFGSAITFPSFVEVGWLDKTLPQPTNQPTNFHVVGDVMRLSDDVKDPASLADSLRGFKRGL